MNVYMYKAAFYCESCGEKARAELPAPADPEDDYSYDSDDWPKGPYPDSGGEADNPQHCDDCGVFLENPLTVDGEQYIREAVFDDAAAGRLDSIAISIWAPFYR